MMYQNDHNEAQQMGLMTPVGFDEAWFEQIFLALDRLHSEVCAENRSKVSLPVAPEHMIGWLEDIIYTAQETICEIRANAPGRDVTEAELSAIGVTNRLESEGSNGTDH